MTNNEQLDLYNSYTQLIYTQGKETYFNLKSFLEKQALIWTKYDSLDKGLSLRTSEKNFINNFDKYILHTLEEVHEFLQEYNNSISTTKEDIINELIDVLMYLGTMNSIIEYNYKEFNNISSPSKDILTINIKFSDPDILCEEILYYLIEVRRLYNKRKWHKISVEMTYLEKIDALSQTSKFITEAMKTILSNILILAHMYKFSIEEIDNLINKKQAFILSL